MVGHMPIVRALAVSGVLLSALAAPTSARLQPPSFADVLQRAHKYVTLYEDHELSTVIARERYSQTWLDPVGKIKGERILFADYLLLQLVDEDWVAVRDVYEVDGKPIAERSARIKAFFDGPREQWAERAMNLAKENARFNLCEQYLRTVNLPTFALRALRPAEAKRMEYSKAGEELVDGTATWVISFREVKGPTFSGTPDGADVPSSGRFWIEPDSGAVVRTEMILGGTRRVSARATITVTYQPEPSLGFRVPVDMRERYDNPRRNDADLVLAAASYSDFRRFDWRTLAKAARARSRVESSVGKGEFESSTISGISVHPRITASQPSSFIRPITR
jgi:hypothetical protein